MTWKDLIGVGIYSVPEAARLTGVSTPRIRRWMTGYTFRSGAEHRRSPPVWKHDIPRSGGSLALSFRDLIEVRFVNAFLNQGVTWKNLRIAAKFAAELLGTTHPFSTERFKTDGKTIFAELAARSGNRALLDLVRRQYALPGILDPYLYEGLEYQGEVVRRWFPRPPSQRVVIDPELAFGQPVVQPEAVPTAVLAAAFAAEGSIRLVARWYEVEEQSVEEALDFERRLAAA
jgi:uncharacterized protein (DUF433 family)